MVYVHFHIIQRVLQFQSDSTSAAVHSVSFSIRETHDKCFKSEHLLEAEHFLFFQEVLGVYF